MTELQDVSTILDSMDQLAEKINAAVEPEVAALPPLGSPPWLPIRVAKYTLEQVMMAEIIYLLRRH